MAAVLLAGLLSAGCGGEAWSSKGFSFRAVGDFRDLKEGEAIGSVTVVSRGGATRRNEKRVLISLNRKGGVGEGSDLLDDEINLTAASIDSRVEWDQFAHLRVVLVEEGNYFADDALNRWLLLEGPRDLVVLDYVQSSTTGRFTRDRIERLDAADPTNGASLPPDRLAAGPVVMGNSFVFPENAVAPTNRDQTVRGFVQIRCRGEFFHRNEKTVQVVAKRAGGPEILNDELTIEDERVFVRTEWRKFERLRVVLWKVGPKNLAVIDYVYSPAEGRFHRERIE